MASCFLLFSRVVFSVCDTFPVSILIFVYVNTTSSVTHFDISRLILLMYFCFIYEYFKTCFSIHLGLYCLFCVWMVRSLIYLYLQKCLLIYFIDILWLYIRIPDIFFIFSCYYLIYLRFLHTLGFISNWLLFTVVYGMLSHIHIPEIFFPFIWTVFRLLLSMGCCLI